MHVLYHFGTDFVFRFLVSFFSSSLLMASQGMIHVSPLPPPTGSRKGDRVFHIYMSTPLQGQGLRDDLGEVVLGGPLHFISCWWNQLQSLTDTDNVLPSHTWWHTWLRTCILPSVDLLIGLANLFDISDANTKIMRWCLQLHRNLLIRMIVQMLNTDNKGLVG